MGKFIALAELFKHVEAGIGGKTEMQKFRNILDSRGGNQRESR